MKICTATARGVKLIIVQIEHQNNAYKARLLKEERVSRTGNATEILWHRRSLNRESLLVMNRLLQKKLCRRGQ